MAYPLLEVNNLGKTFRMHLIDGRSISPFQSIGFTVDRGQLFLISGRSGIGKTTILKSIYRSYLVTEGTIWFDSDLFGRIDLATADDGSILQLREREIGYCSQFLKVLPRVSALEVVAEPLIRRGIDRVMALAESECWMTRMQIDKALWQASPITFSGGEQQRLNLARAFIASPRLLLLDEPTASLDANSKAIVLDIMEEARAVGVAIITVSHDLGSLADMADATLQLANLHP
jgi:alpha-D-ribose 1-methylphosphonate 5-triphosphate synthase subunit PhnL